MSRLLKWYAPNGAELNISDNINYKILKIDGSEAPDLNIFTEKSPYNDGSNYIDSQYQPRIVTVEGFIKATDKPTIAAKRREMIAAFNPKNGQGRLILEYEGSTYEAVNVIASKPLLPDSFRDGIHQQFMLTFECFQPFWQGAETTTEMTYESGGVEFPLINNYGYSGDISEMASVVDLRFGGTMEALSALPQGVYSNFVYNSITGTLYVLHGNIGGTASTAVILYIEHVTIAEDMFFHTHDIYGTTWDIFSDGETGTPDWYVPVVYFEGEPVPPGNAAFPQIIFDDGRTFGDLGIVISEIDSITNINNSGDVSCPMEITFEWTAQNPKIINNTTGYFVEVSHTLTVGQKLIIDSTPNAMGVTLVAADGTETSAYNYITAASRVDKMLLAPGANELEYTSDNNSVGSKVIVKFKPNYLGA